MCGRFYIPEEDFSAELTEIIEGIQRKNGASAVKLGEVCPSDQAAVLANNRSMKCCPFSMRWGYSFHGSKLIINARSETAAINPLFHDGMAQRRCLVPAVRYFEWVLQTESGKCRTKYAFHLSDADMFYMAAIYHFEQDVPAFTVLTREAAPNISAIHDRMSIILPYDTRKDWLNPAYKADEIIQSAQLNINYQVV